MNSPKPFTPKQQVRNTNKTIKLLKGFGFAEIKDRVFALAMDGKQVIVFAPGGEAPFTSDTSWQVKVFNSNDPKDHINKMSGTTSFATMWSTPERVLTIAFEAWGHHKASTLGKTIRDQFNDRIDALKQAVQAI